MRSCVRPDPNRRQYVLVEKCTGTSRDNHGHVDQTNNANWTQYTAGYAEIISGSGREFWRETQLEADVTHVWKCNYSAKLASVTPEMRLKHDGVTYQIVAADDVDLAHHTVRIQTKRAV